MQFIEGFSLELCHIKYNKREQKWHIVTGSPQGNLKDIFVDGTKIEANANRYTFVWGNSIKTNKERIKKQLNDLWSYVEKVYKEEQKTPSEIGEKVQMMQNMAYAPTTTAGASVNYTSSADFDDGIKVADNNVTINEGDMMVEYDIDMLQDIESDNKEHIVGIQEIGNSRRKTFSIWATNQEGCGMCHSASSLSNYAKF